ncbi:uncharacterized protein MAM_07532 [Metarhizium album ARSEF 1941]|uniref:Uncharacterized protein n=1 Tax=Metarhizium album (strain ARSEF 1941) TaxID=1081103 RepID=A0A0B2WFC5_METAS|nr:uncharacterized protein MAM_07532 [Metarhizium album ARSEF 1941]KHN94626.1 hypothetical protein MAM_07532 [Metarhizium album ARSEF 1941]
MASRTRSPGPQGARKRKHEQDHQPSTAPRTEALGASSSLDPDSHWQSVAFFHEVIAGAPHAESKYASLNAEQKLILALGARNLFLAACRSGSARDTDKEILGTLVDILDGDEDPAFVGGMGVSFYPSRGRSMLKYIEDLDRKVRHRSVNHFAQVMKTPRLFAVFVDPAELSYHNFENVVPLDRWLEERMGRRQDEAVEGMGLGLTSVVRLRRDRDVFTASLEGDKGPLLKEIAALSLYVAPLNRGTRGGERFIFHSAILSEALTRAVKTSGLLGVIGDGTLGDSFEFVNYVFRSNKFAPRDGRFENHLDTPYYDRARRHVSKYTLLVYLSAGHNTPLLRVQDVEMDSVEEMACVIFDQRYEHEGRPFLQGDKVFLRTELIFVDENLKRDARISQPFSTACYMTGQGLLDRQLASRAHECFERANSLHWSLDKAAPESVYLLKEFRGLGFVTNGYNYWFSKSENMNLKDYAAISVLDYFNCKIGNKPFRSLASSTIIQQRFGSPGDVWKYLSARRGAGETSPLRRLEKALLDGLFKRAPDGASVGGLGGEHDLSHVKVENPCCPVHASPLFDPWKSRDVMDMYEKCGNYTRGRLLCAPVMMLDNEVVLNEENIQIAGSMIHILQDINKEALAPLNFAACWSDAPMPEAFITLDREIPVPKLLVPPIQWHEFEQGFELVVDFFRNDWMVDVQAASAVPVPRVTQRPEDEGENPFFERLVSDDEEAHGDDGPGEGDGSD